MDFIEDHEAAPVVKMRRPKKQTKPVLITRSSDEWRKLIDDAKKKETYWNKGIVPGNKSFVGVTGEETDGV